jgi:hypothetical protein
MYPAASHAPERTRILDVGQNEIVSWTNHFIVVAFAASGIFANPWVFRFMPARSPSDKGQERHARSGRHGLDEPDQEHSR